MEILMIIIRWAIPFILTALCGYMTSKLKENKKMNDDFHSSLGALKDSMLLLLWSQIINKCETCLEQGYLPSHDRTCLDELFKQYQVLGGNHGVEVLVQKTFDLPPKKERK